jgi:hypothetical protein
MKALLQLLLLGMLLSITSCQEEETSREEVRVQQEVNRRVAVIKDDMKTTEQSWHTIRVSAFCILAGGCLIWLLGGGEEIPVRSERPRISSGSAPEQQPGRRIIDRRQEDYDHEREDDPYPH